MLASTNYNTSSYCSDGTRSYRRDTWLSESIAPRDGIPCRQCHREIKKGEKIAVTMNFTCLCPNCYADMPQNIAEASIAFTGGKCVTVKGTLYRGVFLYDFGVTVVIVSESGDEYRFENMDEAHGFIDATYAMTGALLGALA